MAKKLSSMTWDELKGEMSIAGNPEKITQAGRNIEVILFNTIDASNRADLTNAELMLQRLVAEIRLAQRMYDKSH